MPGKYALRPDADQEDRKLALDLLAAKGCNRRFCQALATIYRFVPETPHLPWFKKASANKLRAAVEIVQGLDCLMSTANQKPPDRPLAEHPELGRDPVALVDPELAALAAALEEAASLVESFSRVDSRSSHQDDLLVRLVGHILSCTQTENWPAVCTLLGTSDASGETEDKFRKRFERFKRRCPEAFGRALEMGARVPGSQSPARATSGQNRQHALSET